MLCESDYVYQKVGGYLHLPVCVQATVNTENRLERLEGRSTGPEAQAEGLFTAKN